jgi:hypothetical protein
MFFLDSKECEHIIPHPTMHFVKNQKESPSFSFRNFADSKSLMQFPVN